MEENEAASLTGGVSVDYDYNLHATSPFHDLVLVAGNLESLAALSVPNDRDVGQPVFCLKGVKLLVFLLVAVSCIPCVHEVNLARVRKWNVVLNLGVGLCIAKQE